MGIYKISGPTVAPYVPVGGGSGGGSNCGGNKTAISKQQTGREKEDAGTNLKQPKSSKRQRKKGYLKKPTAMPGTRVKEAKGNGKRATRGRKGETAVGFGFGPGRG